MYLQMSAVIVDANNENRQELALFLSHFGVSVVAQFTTVEQLATFLNKPDAPALAVVNLDPAAHDNLRKVAALPRQFQQVSFFLMSTVMDPHLLMEAMHVGVREFIPLPISEEKFAAAIERVAQINGVGKRAKVIHVIPTMGGCGSTTIACNVAASLAQKSKTCLIDLDLIRGGVASYFDTRPRYTIADVVDSADSADKQLLDNALSIHKASGVALLGRPEMPEDTLRVNAPGLQRLVTVLGRMFDYVVVDSMMSIDPVYSAAIAASDLNVIIMQLNVPSAKNAERFVGALRRKGIESSKIKIVVNRYEKKNRDIEPEAVERALGLKIAHLVPNDFRNAIAAINFGEPVVLRAPRAEMSTSLSELAAILGSRTASAGIAA
jgi:pilus assembly protein CpaE